MFAEFSTFTYPAALSAAAHNYLAFRAQHGQQDFDTLEWSSCLPMFPTNCRPCVNRDFLVHFRICNSQHSAQHTAGAQ